LRLSRKSTKARIARLGNWTLRGNAITRNFRFIDFGRAMRFVNKVAKLAEAANHHPDISIRYNKVRLVLTTHDEGALTEKDFKLAGRINRLVK
jgi:4a-hydroxytetrahydrobiopterin dehydratase